MAVHDILGSLGMYAALATLAAIVVALVLGLAGPFDQDLPPWPLFKFGLWAAGCLDAMRDGLLPPHIRAVEIGFSYVRPQVMHALAALNLPDLLHDGPKPAAELAPMAGVRDVDKLDHLLRAAVALRLLAVSGRASTGTVRCLQLGPANRYRNTALSETLREDNPRSVRAIVCTNMEDCLPAYAQLVEGLRQDKVPFEMQNDGLDLWEYLKRKPKQEAQFSAAMTSLDVTGTPAIAADFGWGAYDRIIDVAGAHGAVLAAIMAAHPRVRGVLFDLPQVIERAKEEWTAKRSALLERTDFVGGDFFDAATLPAPAPASRDAYMLRNVLHDWNDAKTTDILRSLRTMMGESKTATLVVVEVIPHSDIAREDLPARQMLDIQMIVVVDGKERSPEDWVPMLSKTGFKLCSIHPTRGSFRILLATPV